MTTMPGRTASKAYVGRRAQLDALRQALVDVGKSRGHVVLVGGEAGIGKTRLLAEFEALVAADPPAGRSVLVVHGSCSGAAAGSLPFLPILDLLDGLVASGRVTDTVASVHADLAGSSGDASSPGPRSHTFLGFRDAVVVTAADVDLVLVVDDLHWADRSTLELLTFVAPRLGDARVMLVGAYRSDELHRRHPLRPVLVELEHAGSLAHLRLESLSPEEVAAQLEAIRGPCSLPRTLPGLSSSRTGTRSTSRSSRTGPRRHQAPAGTPGRARGPPLSPVRSGAGGAVGRGGHRAGRRARAPRRHRRDPSDGHRGRAPRERPATVIPPTPDGRRYRFRHALLSEAVREDLLPAERNALHRRLAAVLTARPELGAESPAGAAAEIAHHWTEAGDRANALPAWIEAGRSAGAAHAWQESASAYEQALSLAAAGAEGLIWMRRPIWACEPR